MNMSKEVSKKHTKGFTLVELMIASTILIMVMLVGTYAYSLFAKKWDEQLGNVNQAMWQIKELTLINSLLDGIVPLALFNQREGKGFYFIGEQQSLIAISLQGLVNQDQPVVFSLSLQLQGNENVLIYREASTSTNLILNTQQQIRYQHQLVLLKGLKNINFDYFGWPSFAVKARNSFEPSSRGPRASWYKKYNGQDAGLHPEKLTLSLGLVNGDIYFSSQFTQNSEILLQSYEGL